MPERDATVLIIGGGIAGLTAAIALRQRGIDALVFEQADDLRKTQVGGGLALHVNVARAFEQLDLLDPLMEVAVPIEGFQFTTDKGRELGTASGFEGELTQGILRSDFHQFLVNTVGEGTMQLGANLVRFEQDDGGVTAHFADGSKARGDLLIGADGMQSTVRKQLLGESEPRYAGYCLRRGVVQTESAKDGVMRAILGRGERFIYLPVGRWYMYWIAARNEPPGGAETGADMKRTVLERFQGWPDPVESLVEATDESSMVFADIYDRDPIERWGEGRVTLLGDSAHPMTFDRGQGASQGIEGALFLAKQLAQDDDPTAALRAWEAMRMPRTAKVVLSSRKTGKLHQAEKLPVCLIRNQVIRVATRGAVFQRVNRDLLVEY